MSYRQIENDINKIGAIQGVSDRMDGYKNRQPQFD
jgi:hypothetical protein